MNKWIVGIFSVALLQVALVALLSSDSVSVEVAGVSTEEPVASALSDVAEPQAAGLPDTVTIVPNRAPGLNTAPRITNAAAVSRSTRRAAVRQPRSRTHRLYADRIIYYDRTGSLVEDRGMASVIRTGYPYRRTNTSPQRTRRRDLEGATASSTRSRRTRDLATKL